MSITLADLNLSDIHSDLYVFERDNNLSGDLTHCKLPEEFIILLMTLIKEILVKKILKMSMKGQMIY